LRALGAARLRLFYKGKILRWPLDAARLRLFFLRGRESRQARKFARLRWPLGGAASAALAAQ
jgi:hypothetical protein